MKTIDKKKSQVGKAKTYLFILSVFCCISVSAQTNTFPFPSSGNVGIGTTSPGAYLQIKDLDLSCGAYEVPWLCPLLFRADYFYNGQIGDGCSSINTGNVFEVFGNNCAGNPPVETFRITNYGDIVCGNNWLRVTDGGRVGIGTGSPAYELDVAGTIRCQEVKVCLSGCDFVFEKNYQLKSLNEMEKFTKENKRLPHFASAQEMELSDGVSVGQMNSKLLQSVEEIYLHLFELNNKVKELSKENAELKMQVQTLNK